MNSYSSSNRAGAFGDPFADPFGAVHESALADDLHLLLGGPGAQPGQVMSRIGPALRTMCGISIEDSTTEAISAIAAWLRSQVAALSSEEDRTCALLAFGLHDTIRLSSRGARVAAVADYLGRTTETARRHVTSVITAIARATRPYQSVPLQLRARAGTWVDLGITHDSHNQSHGQSHTVVTTRCLLIAAARAVDRPDRVYAVIRSPHDRVATVVPAVRVRHVTPAPLPDPAVTASDPD